MRTRVFVLSFAFVVLIALTRMSPISTTLFAQQQAGQGRRATTVPPFQGPPPGVQPLPIDIFSSKNFYKDQKLWLDQRYYRCNTSRQMEDLWTSHRIGLNPPESVSWGDCSADSPREKIVSPYPYKTAKEHYEALMAAAKAKGGPTIYTKATIPDWDGYYARDLQSGDHGVEWIWGFNQVPTLLSVLTPEYQKRMIQMQYHYAVDNAPQLEAAFCHPEGFMRWWAQRSAAGNFQVRMTPWNIQLLSGVADNFLRQILIGKEHVQKVPQWYGETVGFWDGTALITWTANVQGWTLSHDVFEFSNKMETIEIFTPVNDSNGKFKGLAHEAVFYDPEAFVQPLRATSHFVRQATPDDPNRRYTYVECLSNIQNTNGRATQLTKEDPRFIDYYGRPWAQNWEKYFEVGWEKPQNSDVPVDVLDIFK